MRERSRRQRCLDWVRRNERRLIGVYLGSAVAALGAWAVFGIALQGAERLVDLRAERFAARTAGARALVDQGRWPEALAALEALDREHPARTVLYARDREREEILGLLGTAQLALGKKRLGLETFARLAAFDPLNWQNHFALAEAARGAGELDLALASYASVLGLHGTHLPTVQALVDVHGGLARFETVAAVWERYLDAYRLAPLELCLPSGAPACAPFEVPADGLPHTVSAELELEGGWSGALELRTGGYSIAVESLALTPLARAGELGDPAPPAPAPRPELRALGGGQLGSDGTFLAAGAASACALEVAAPARGSARATLVVRVFKAADLTTWRIVQHAFENLVDPERQARALARTQVGGCLEAGSLFEP